MKLLNIVREKKSPLLNNLDSSQALKDHREIISRNLYLEFVYKSFYYQFKNTSYPNKKIVELGSGAGFIKEIMPNVITSDVIKAKGIQKVFFAEKMPFKNSTIGGFIMLNVFHHIKKSENALKEMDRCLIKGGKIVMIEPANTIWSRFIYKYFHHEEFNAQGSWKIPGKRRMSDANIALPWIIFIRDKSKFEKKFKNLKIKKITYHTPISYLISGGLSHKPFMPVFTYRWFSKIEEILIPFNKYFGMFMTIEIEKD